MSCATGPPAGCGANVMPAHCPTPRTSPVAVRKHRLTLFVLSRQPTKRNLAPCSQQRSNLQSAASTADAIASSGIRANCSIVTPMAPSYGTSPLSYLRVPKPGRASGSPLRPLASGAGQPFIMTMRSWTARNGPLNWSIKVKPSKPAAPTPIPAAAAMTIPNPASSANFSRPCATSPASQPSTNKSEASSV